MQGSPFNIKVTRDEDLATAAAEYSMTRRCRCESDRDSTSTPSARATTSCWAECASHIQRVVAHSDGDVVIHALCDAVLGALGDGDIGRHFPDSDPRYRGADSRVFLRVVAGRMRAAG